MGLFKRKKKIIETKTCIVDDGLRNMWHIFNKVPWRVYERETVIELNWIALNSWEEEYIQYAWLRGIPPYEVEIEDGPQKLLIRSNGFIYEGNKCKNIVVPSWYCSEFGCKALLLSPDEAIRRLLRLYEKYKAKAKSA